MDRKDLDSYPHDLSQLFMLMGQLSSDVHRVLEEIKESHANVSALRSDLSSDLSKLREDMDQEHKNINDRLNKVEKFNVRVLTYGSVAATILIAFVRWGVPRLMEMM